MPHLKYVDTKLYVSTFHQPHSLYQSKKKSVWIAGSLISNLVLFHPYPTNSFILNLLSIKNFDHKVHSTTPTIQTFMKILTEIVGTIFILSNGGGGLEKDNFCLLFSSIFLLTKGCWEDILLTLKICLNNMWIVLNSDFTWYQKFLGPRGQNLWSWFVYHWSCLVQNLAQ